MGDMLTMREIRERCPSQWVLIEDPETTPALEVVRGRLAWHGDDYEALCRASEASRAPHTASLHTGAESDATAYWL